MPSKKYQLEIFGLMKDAEFYQAKVTAEVSRKINKCTLDR